MNWTDARKAELVQLFNARPIMSAAEIARAMGDGLSRNAVMGKLHRMGMKRGRKPAKPRAEKTVAELRRKRVNNNPLGFGWSKPKRHPKLPSRPSELNALSELRKIELPPRRRTDVPEPASLQIGILDLTNKTCKWPHGDPGAPGFGFCGHHVHANLPYCEHHAERAYGRTERAGWTPEQRAKFFRTRAMNAREAALA